MIAKPKSARYKFPPTKKILSTLLEHFRLFSSPAVIATRRHLPPPLIQSLNPRYPLH